MMGGGGGGGGGGGADRQPGEGLDLTRLTGKREHFPMLVCRGLFGSIAFR